MLAMESASANAQLGNSLHNVLTDLSLGSNHLPAAPVVDLNTLSVRYDDLLPSAVNATATPPAALAPRDQAKVSTGTLKSTEAMGGRESGQVLTEKSPSDKQIEAKAYNGDRPEQALPAVHSIIDAVPGASFAGKDNIAIVQNEPKMFSYFAPSEGAVFGGDAPAQQNQQSAGLVAGEETFPGR